MLYMFLADSEEYDSDSEEDSDYSPSENEEISMY